MKSVFFYETILGRVGIADNGVAITNIFFKNTVAPLEYQIHESDLIRMAAAQLQEYFDGRRTEFALPLAPEGSNFCRKVWNALLTIPFGTTKSYGEIAAQISAPKAARAVGRASGLNPISIIIPCHRVIGANGALTGYAGGLDVKVKLLELEGAYGYTGLDGRGRGWDTGELAKTQSVLRAGASPPLPRPMYSKELL